MAKYEIPDISQDEAIGPDVLLDQYKKLLAGRKEADIKDEDTIAELAKLKTAMLLAQATAKKIDKELSWAGTRSEEGVAVAQEWVKKPKTDDIKLVWEKSDPDANVNYMMDHLQNYEQAKQREMNDVRIQINSMFRRINEIRAQIITEILPNCKNEYKRSIENSLNTLVDKIILVNEDLETESHSPNFDIEKAKSYAARIQVFTQEIETLYDEGLDDLTDLD